MTVTAVPEGPVLASFPGTRKERPRIIDKAQVL